MTELEEKQRKRRFWVWFTLTIIMGVVCFYSGYELGKYKGAQSSKTLTVSREIGRTLGNRPE